MALLHHNPLLNPLMKQLAIPLSPKVRDKRLVIPQAGEEANEKIIR
jgi:hypothetical protein